MAKFNDQWKVGPHGPVARLDEGLLSVAGEIRMPLGNFPRRMTAAALSGGRAVVWSPIPLREPEMREIESLGEIAFLIVPGIGHRLDIRPWKARYPAAKILCAPGARAAVEEAIPVDSIDDIMDDPAVSLEVVPGVGAKESALLVRRNGYLSLIVNDILANVRHPRGIGAHIMARLLGFGVKRPRMPRIGKRMFVKDAARLAEAFRGWAREPGLARVVVSHGDVIAEAPGAALERAAADLDG